MPCLMRFNSKDRYDREGDSTSSTSYVSENLTTDRRHRGKSAMLLLLPQREQDPNYQNFINIPVVCGILQTPLDVVHNGNISLNGPVVEFSSE